MSVQITPSCRAGRSSLTPRALRERFEVKRPNGLETYGHRVRRDLNVGGAPTAATVCVIGPGVT